MSNEPEAREAEHGEKMIELKVRFWTRDLAGPGQIRPKHGWTAGVVRIKRNESHGIVPGKSVPFNSLMDLPAAIEQLLIQEGVTLHVAGQMRMRKYIEK